MSAWTIKLEKENRELKAYAKRLEGYIVNDFCENEKGLPRGDCDCEYCEKTKAVLATRPEGLS